MKEIANVANKCKKCGRIHYPFHARCVASKARDFETIKPQGNARLFTYIRINNLPWGFNQRYLPNGISEFEDGVHAIGKINADEGYSLASGMAMKASWDPVWIKASKNVHRFVYMPSTRKSQFNQICTLAFREVILSKNVKKC